MKKFTKKLSALALTTVFATMQIGYASEIGLGQGLGGADFQSANGGFKNLTTGTGTATLEFTGDSHVKWNTLNVGTGETLNFNAVDGAKNLTILNTVNTGMSTFQGAVNADGIAKLIISNPNGVLFDGAKFSTAGDLAITTQALNGQIVEGNLKLETLGQPIAGVVSIKNNSNLVVGGNLNFVGKTVDAVESVLKGDNIKFTTTNGQDYLVSGCCQKTPVVALTLDNVTAEGDVYVVTDKGSAKIVNGGLINGNLDAKIGGDGFFNASSGGNRLTVNGDVKVHANGEEFMLRHTDVKGNIDITNDKGYVDIASVRANGDVKLTTHDFDDITNKKYNHFVHVVGQNDIKGNITIDSAQNIHIGGYVLDKDTPKVYDTDGKFYYNGKLMENGYLKVGGNLDAKAASGHITTTSDVTAKNISYVAHKGNNGTRDFGGNILSDGKAVLKADTYQFEADGYIGAFKDNGNGYTVDNKIINVMEDYTHIPADTASHEYLTINGGTVTKIKTPKTAPDGRDVQVYIKSLDNVIVNGADAGVINLTAPEKKIEITGDVHAKEINVGPETNYLKLDFPGRDFTTNYTNIRDEKVVTIRPDEVITYGLTDEQPNGYNAPTLQPGEKTTYLIGPGPQPEPVNPNPIVPNDENARNLMTHWAPEDATAAPINTPVAFAADLDEDDIDAAVRKNVDGSVTVVRAFPMGK